MPVRVYLVPKIGDGLSPTSAFRPKYSDRDSLGAGWNISGRWQGYDYGSESSFLLIANTTAEEHTTLNAQTDVLTVPDLDSQISAIAVNVVQSKLEAVNIPAGWVSTALTYRRAWKIVRKIITYMQKYNELYNESAFTGGLNLNTRVNQIPAARRQRLATAAQALGLSTAAITGTTTIRQALKIFADQMADMILMGEAL